MRLACERYPLFVNTCVHDVALQVLIANAEKDHRLLLDMGETNAPFDPTTVDVSGVVDGRNYLESFWVMFGAELDLWRRGSGVSFSCLPWCLCVHVHALLISILQGSNGLSNVYQADATSCGEDERRIGILHRVIGFDAGRHVTTGIEYFSVHNESTDTWDSCLTLLDDATHGVLNNEANVFLDDKAKGLEGAITRRFPKAKHFFCSDHGKREAERLCGASAGPIFARIVHATTQARFDAAWECASPKLQAHLDKRDRATWAVLYCQGELGGRSASQV